MKKFISVLAMAALILPLAACGKESGKKESAGVDALVSEYGFQWTDTSAPILNEKGAQEISFHIYSSKNASALDYNDMKIMQDLFESTNVNVTWENVSESVYSQQKNLILGNADNRPDAIYHAGMGAGEIIKYAKRKVLLPISDYLEYMPN
ncbi:MAG: extracellular solute-binding protein, partial [Lachnospiraceae bacterium]|nr:extracellular solute-binding protein [Lachnospiraceae bacterium]